MVYVPEKLNEGRAVCRDLSDQEGVKQARTDEFMQSKEVKDWQVI